MAVIPADTGGVEVELDICKSCACVWFDPGERGVLPQTTPPTSTKSKFSPEAREAIAMVEVDKIRREREESESQGAPEETWKWLPGLFGLPVECGVPTVGTRPWVTWGTAALCIVVFAGILASAGNSPLGNMILTWGFIPVEWFRMAGATLVASFFIHAGLLHILGNIYFLIIFGDNVEDQLGWKRYALLLLGAHLAGIVMHGLVDPRGSVPVVGASAGVSGIIAYYAVAFPRARLGFLFWARFSVRWIRMPVWVAFLIWTALQVFGAWKQIAGFTNVSALGHLGGAAVGFVAALALRRRRREALDLVGGKRGRYDRSSGNYS
jgi:membrane associated rhomboid family serine protease